MTDLNPITNRRRFVKQTGLAAGALALSQPFTVLGQAAPKKLKVGIVGCGGRGKIVSEMALKDGRYEIVSLADYFKDQADTLGEKFNVPSERRFTGLDCYKRLIDAGGIDIIAILSPPYFHPDQVEAAVEAGLHVWLAKPIAIDTPGVKRVVVAAQKAASQKRCFLVDFQTRALDSYHEAARRVAAGDLGTLGYAEIEATSLAFKLKAPDTGYESRLRNWLQWKDLCGENVVEFSIHAIDMASLFIGKPPVSATGFCERQFVDHTPETHPGDVRDVCNVVYDYGDGFKCVLRAKRFDHHKISGGIEVGLFGTKGGLFSSYQGEIYIKGEKSFSGDRHMGERIRGIYNLGIANNWKTFYKNITEEDYSQATVQPSADSHYLALLAREAAYLQGKPITWDEITKSEKTSQFDTGKLKV
jgi:myo-inositol 2-dehydrogenase/D-chiro-inositol 1-dehydrogenase